MFAASHPDTVLPTGRDGISLNGTATNGTKLEAFHGSYAPRTSREVHRSRQHSQKDDRTPRRPNIVDLSQTALSSGSKFLGSPMLRSISQPPNLGMSRQKKLRCKLSTRRCLPNFLCRAERRIKIFEPRHRR